MPTMSLSPSGSKSPEKRATSDKTKDSQIDVFLHDFAETGSVRVGKDYQATVPEHVGSAGPLCKADDKSILLWSPPDKLTEAEYYEYVVVAGKEYKYSLEQALGFLQWHNHDVKCATKDLAQYVPVSDEWSVEDVLIFEQAFAFNGKCFNRIQQMLPNKTMASLVKFYYSWKKRTNRDLPSHVDQSDKRRLASDDDDYETNSETSEKRRKIPDTKHCKNCSLFSGQLYVSPHGKLCNTCFAYFRRTGHLKEMPSKRRSTDQHDILEEPDYDADSQRNHKAPKNMNLGAFVSMAEKVSVVRNADDDAESKPSSSSTPCSSFDYDFYKDKNNEKLIFEVRSYRERSIRNRLTISQMRQNLSGVNDISQKIPQRPKPVKALYKWSQHEILLVLQGFRLFGKDFRTIGDLLGTKTADQIRTFYNANRHKYDIDALIKELEHQKSEETTAKDDSIVVLSDDDKETEIVLIDD